MTNGRPHASSAADDRARSQINLWRRFFFRARLGLSIRIHELSEQLSPVTRRCHDDAASCRAIEYLGPRAFGRMSFRTVLNDKATWIVVAGGRFDTTGSDPGAPPIVQQQLMGRRAPLIKKSSGVGVANDCRNPDGYSSRSASTGATLDARSAGSHDAASTVASDMAAAISSVRGSLGAMP